MVPRRIVYKTPQTIVFQVAPICCMTYTWMSLVVLSTMNNTKLHEVTFVVVIFKIKENQPLPYMFYLQSMYPNEWQSYIKDIKNKRTSCVSIINNSLTVMEWNGTL